VEILLPGACRGLVMIGQLLDCMPRYQILVARSRKGGWGCLQFKNPDSGKNREILARLQVAD